MPLLSLLLLISIFAASCNNCSAFKILLEKSGTVAGYSGNFSIGNYENSRDRLIYGPYKNVLTGPMRNFASFTPTFSEHIKSSELCASCHDLTTPYSDEQGQILSHNIEEEFPEQMVYVSF
jgi:hypothetical protein